MSVYGNAEDYSRDQGKLYRCNCNNGKCSSCGECCTDILPLSARELQRLKDYANKHMIQEHRHQMFWDPNAVDMTCPFRDDEHKKCEVYKVRPQICRQFICSKASDQAQRDRDRIASEGRAYRSLRFEVFGNPETVRFIAACVMNGVENE